MSYHDGYDGEALDAMVWDRADRPEVITGDAEHCNATCMFCGGAEDSIEHHCTCSVVLNIF